MVLSELVVRHTRHRSPTRRVAVERFKVAGDAPPFAPGLLLGGVVAGHIGFLDDPTQDRFADLLGAIAQGEPLPARALRYRVQTDLVGLDRSGHRLVAAGDAPVLEIDRHGPAAPQVLGALMALATLRGQQRRVAVRMVRAARELTGQRGHEIVRILLEEAEARIDDAPAQLTSNEERALRTLGFGDWERPTRPEVSAAFRRLVRGVHPDHGAEVEGAGQRMAELASARQLLLAGLTE